MGESGGRVKGAISVMVILFLMIFTGWMRFACGEIC